MYYLALLVDHLTQSVRPSLLLPSLARFDTALLNYFTTATGVHVGNRTPVDKLTKRRIRLPARFMGGSLRARTGWVSGAAYWGAHNRAGFGWGEAVRFFEREALGLRKCGFSSAASTKIPLLRARFQRAIGLGRGISRSAPPGAICVLPSGTAGSIALFFCKKRNVTPYICWTGLSYPHSNVPKPRLRSKVFRGRTWGTRPGAQNPRFQGAAERGGEQF
jgi:hypothetical protein